MKFYPRDTELLCRTVLIGMPAAGKSTISARIAAGVRRDTGAEM